MSTKIYDAFKFDGTPEELMEFLFKFRSEYISAAVDDLYPIFEAMSMNETDDEIYSNFNDIRNYFDTNRGLEKIIERGHNDVLNINASVVVYFYKGKTVAQFFGLDFGMRKSSPNLRKMIESDERFSDYSYWNNTDPDENVTEEEWDEREEFYDDLTEKFSFFNSIGLVYELSNIETTLKICKLIADKYMEKENGKKAGNNTKN